MPLTMQQIADLAGVSRGTVDRALHNRGRIDPRVAERIRQIAANLGYVPKKTAKARGSLAKVKIGVITQLTKAAFMSQIYRGLADAKKELQYRNIDVRIEACASVDEEEQLAAIEKLTAEHMAGLAIMPVNSPRIGRHLNQITQEKNIPLVTFNTDIPGLKRKCFIGLDNQKSGRTAAGLMGMLTGGAGRILIITGFFSNSTNSLRVDGFLQELKNSYPALEVVGVQSSFDDAREVRRIVLQALETFPALSGIFIASGGQAGVWWAFRQLSLPKRPYVIVYDITPDNHAALVGGAADFLIDQQGYVQGYRAPLILADILLGTAPPDREHLYTHINILTKHNIPALPSPPPD